MVLIDTIYATGTNRADSYFSEVCSTLGKVTPSPLRLSAELLRSLSLWVAIMTHIPPGVLFLRGPQEDGRVQLPLNHTIICIFVTDSLASASTNRTL